ncbi:uncharacterized protein BDR25DRAFT_321393 [Lindgomyces ingoldianus]|uniref:Uncharacterized protein n=1 Tax=Lindgomyces ingoldianus TaxID=673940 RepID=A0ACB6RGY8_9PLEO|nr:uncharacterized protein BDR25DRAFT_321393 [Lindgomyces ingoldianus]KAF2478397.1 hypothetical protein BDR25DRAFT_321393 [Lindgomyces ingoldianus]
MEAFANALLGVPGQCLNVEQRKRLTIGVELAANPELFLFLDEPTSGLDSQTAWMICTILCTIHQPSSTLLQMFDRLLLIEKGGRTLYCGEVGPRCETMVSYLESKGARPCGQDENPAEWMMEATAPESSIEWHQEWKNSSQQQELLREIEQLASTSYWRDPVFLWAKFLFTCGSTLVIAFSCWKEPEDLQGLQTQLFSIFLFFTSFSAMMQQTVPQFTERRAIFEAREGPSKIFSWKAFLLSAILTDAIFQIILSAQAFALLYYTMGMNLDIPQGEERERAALMFLFFLAFLLFTSTFSCLLTVGMEHRETIINIGSLLFYLILIFCGILVPYNDLPKFWTFMYWLSPLTYLIRGMFATGIVGKQVPCSAKELLKIPAPGFMSCKQYLAPFISSVGGMLSDDNATGFASTVHWRARSVANSL